MKRLLLLASLTLCLPACWVTAEQGQVMEADLVKMKSEVRTYRQDAIEEATKAEHERERLRDQQDAEIKKIDAKIKEVNGALDELSRIEHKTGADLSVQLDQQTSEVARLRGLVEEYQMKNSVLQQSVTQLQNDLQARVAALEKRTTDESSRKKAVEEARVADEDARKKADDTLPTDKDELYKLAKKTYDDGQLPKARDLFTRFLEKWKSDTLSANAQFWLAETWYQENDFRRAGLEFQKVCDKYPKSEKAPEAELKVAYSFLKLDLTDDARSFLQAVIDTYPKSSAAKQAEKKLKELKKNR
jgi:tol-pal system protein YbgF